jgi:hypothetical protein
MHYSGLADEDVDAGRRSEINISTQGDEMASQQEEFQAAYRAWKDAFDRYGAQIDKIFAGNPNAYSEIQPIIADLEALRLEFMEKSNPFVRWKS